MLKMWATRTIENPAAVRMAAMTPGTVQGTMQVPFPTVGRETYLSKIKGAGIFKRAEDAPVERVPLKELNGIQQTVNSERLAGYVENPKVKAGTRAPGHGGLIDKPVVVRVGGKLYIHDGHHRAAAAKIRGDIDISSRVVDLDADPGFQK